MEYGKIPEVYNVEKKQVSGPSVEPGTTMRLVATLGEEEVYRSEFVTNDYHNLSYRWPDMLCSQGIQKKTLLKSKLRLLLVNKWTA
ncbi:hypothetical protein QW180_18270 [Vibrio sinaloensis]|nr:hypothetical protein [Vibrio sinaloensis]